MQMSVETQDNSQQKWKSDTVKIIRDSNQSYGQHALMQKHQYSCSVVQAPHKSRAVTAVESAPLGCASAPGDTFSHN